MSSIPCRGVYLQPMSNAVYESLTSIYSVQDIPLLYASYEGNGFGCLYTGVADTAAGVDGSSNSIQASQEAQLQKQVWLNYFSSSELSYQQTQWIERIANHPDPSLAMVQLPIIQPDTMLPCHWAFLAYKLEMSKTHASKGICNLIDIFIFDLCDSIFRCLWSIQELDERQKFLNLWTPSVACPSFEQTRFHQKLQAMQNHSQSTCSKVARVAVTRFKAIGIMSVDTLTIIPAHPAPDNSREKAVKPFVLQASVENAYHSMGGLGEVVMSVHQAQQQVGKVNFWGYYPLYERDKYLDELRELEPYAVIQHLYSGKEVFSVIYRHQSKKLFLVNPDQRAVGRLFDVGPIASLVYSQVETGNVFDRSFYLGSSLAVFGATSLGSKKVHIIQADSIGIASAAFELLDSMKESFEQKGYELPKKVAVLHGLCRMHLNEHLYLGIGACTLNTPLIQLLHSVAYKADKLVAVSNFYGKQLMSRDPEISEGLSAVPDHIINYKMHPITNGFDSRKFDITNSELMKGWACHDVDNISGYKLRVKQALYENGIIADSSRPLVIYVGRFSYEKGVALLPAIAQEVVKQGGQIVVMGISAGCMNPINELIKMSQDESIEGHQFIKTYIDPADQSKLIDGVKAGSLIRAAADLFVVPSYIESFGLVPLEANVAGCPVILPYAHAFKETMKPANMVDSHGILHSIEHTATAYCYKEPRNPQQAIQAIQEAFTGFLTLSPKERSLIAKRLHESTIQTHGWYNQTSGRGRILGYIELFNSLMPSSSSSSFSLQPASTSLPLLRAGENCPERAHALGSVVSTQETLDCASRTLSSIREASPIVEPKASLKGVATRIPPAVHANKTSGSGFQSKTVSLARAPLSLTDRISLWIAGVIQSIREMWNRLCIMYSSLQMGYRSWI